MNTGLSGYKNKKKFPFPLVICKAIFLNLSINKIHINICYYKIYLPFSARSQFYQLSENPNRGKLKLYNSFYDMNPAREKLI